MKENLAKFYKWLFIPYKVTSKEINFQILLDNEHFSRVGNIELILDTTYQKLLTREKLKGYVV
jgi:hypothetical protein